MRGEQRTGPFRRSEIGILGLALLLRTAYVLSQQRWALFFGGDLEGPDTRLYRELGQSLVAGFGLVSPGPVGWKESGYPFSLGPTAWVMPGYPVFLAACRLLFGGSMLAVRLVQSALGALTCVFIARTATRLFGRRAGWMAGLTAAVYYELIFSVTGVATETLYTCLVALMLCVLAAALNLATRTYQPITIAGLLFGAAALVRPQAFGAALCLACLMAIQAAREKKMTELARAAVFTAALVAALLPWGFRNKFVLGQFALLPTESGYVLWLGNNAGYDRMASDFSQFGGYSPAAVLKRLPEAGGRPEVEVNRLYRAAAISHIVSHPWRWVARAPHKLWNMWRPAEIASSLRHRLVAWTLYPALLVASALGLWESRRMREAWPLRTFLLVNLVLHAAVTGELRFRVPLWPALIPFSGLGFSRTVDFWRARVARTTTSHAVC